MSNPYHDKTGSSTRDYLTDTTTNALLVAAIAISCILAVFSYGYSQNWFGPKAGEVSTPAPTSPTPASLETPKP